MGHLIVFIIYPRDGKAVIFDSLREMNKKGYKDFENYLRSKWRHVLLCTQVHIKFVVDTSGLHTTFIGNTRKILNAMIGDPTIRSRSMAQTCALGNNSRYVWRSYVLLHRACYPCPNNYVLHASSAPNNLKAQYCVDTMFVTTSGIAEVTVTPSGSSKNL